MKRARPSDVPSLVDLMAAFYAEAGYGLDRARAASAFETLIADERLGYVWLIQADGNDVGHVVLTIRFGMEFAGPLACLDDLYVVPAYRNQGLSTAALGEVRRFCERIGIRALTVEVGATNGFAQTVYRRAGFSAREGRQLLALATPAHIL